MSYCPACGTKLQLKFLEHEGEIPYCSHCQAFRFPQYNVAISAIVRNPAADKILLLQQYGGQRNILLAGYVNRGEAAEQAVAREVQEEVQLDVQQIKFNRSEFFEKSNTLMLNFSCQATSEQFVRNQDEVDQVNWFSFATARQQIAAGSLAEKFLDAYLDQL
jgi:NTP pyrophosphohydrolases containing a Zn-finger, probably nucleic-acid-binding